MSDRSLTSERLRDLLKTIAAHRCVLFLGPHAAIAASQQPIDVELEPLVRRTLKDKPPAGVSLAHLCQLGGEDAREAVLRHLDELDSSRAFSPVHAGLAKLPFPLIIQTTADPLMVNALVAAKRPPQVEAYDFRSDKALIDLESLGTEQNPLVYGLRGLWNLPRSVPLSTDEEASHLVALLREQPGLPGSLCDALRDSGKLKRSALFVGFDFAAWQTRLLFHALFATAPTTVMKPSPAVATPQLRPPPPSVEDMEFWWASYRIVFASQKPKEFAADLAKGWKELQALQPAPPLAREPNLAAFVSFIDRNVPDNTLDTDLMLHFRDFQREFFDAWQQGRMKSRKARDLVTWVEAHKQWDELIELLQETVPEAYAAENETLFQ